MPKRNIKKIKEQMKKLQAQMRQAERDFYTTFGMEVEKKIQSNDITVEDIKGLYEKLKQEYGL